MKKKIAIVGIDSLDPYILLKYRNKLPNFSNIIKNSPTLFSESIFPTDTIPAWGSIYTGLKPENHGMMYIYDIFDPNLSDLKKIDINRIKGKTFWDYSSLEGYKSAIIYPMLMYPPWEINGLMISKSPFDNRINWLETEIDIDTFPKNIKNEFDIPNKLKSLWGGFPGRKNLELWSEIGKNVIKKEKEIGMKIFEGHDWDLFYIYFSLLDIIQHRFWRFFEEKDPTYPGKTNLNEVIIEYYKIFDDFIGEIIEKRPDISLMVISDHGHKIRPMKTFNINEYLRGKGYLISKSKNRALMNLVRESVLKTANKLNIEHFLIKIVVKNSKLTKMSKSVYSSSGSIDKSISLASLSNFAGIKSYSYGGIEINDNLLTNKEYKNVSNDIINDLLKLKTPDKNEKLFNFVKTREELLNGEFTENIFPNIVFELKNDYCVGWDLHSDLFGNAYDHKVASGGHSKDAVILINNFNYEIQDRKISLIDIAPSILEHLEIDWRSLNLDGRSFI